MEKPRPRSGSGPEGARSRIAGAKRPAPGSTEESIASSSFDKPDRSTEESIASSSFDKPANAELEAFSCTGPEQFSAAAASKFNFEMPDLVSLCDLLTSEIPARGGGSGDEFAWSTGAYVHGGVHGCRQHLRQFPVTSAFLAKVFRSCLPDVPFTTLCLSKDVRTSLHLDANNALGFLNGVIRASPFVDGGIWVECSSGSTPCPEDPSRLGKVLNFSSGAIVFDPHQKHLTMPWTRGPRVVLIGFVVKAPEAMPQDVVRELDIAGFHVPAHDTATTLTGGVHHDPASLGLGPGAPRVTPKPCSVKAGEPLFIQLCAGDGLLSALVSDRGFATLAVDFWRSRSKPYVHVVGLDLTLPSSWEYLTTVLRTRQVAHVYATPPTSTTVMPKPRANQGVSLLRDSANPWGVPECSSLDSARLQSANRIFIQLASFCDLARKLGIPFTVEHPCDSWLWRLPPFLELRDALSSSVVQLGFCGSRIAKAAILSTAPFLKELCVSPGQGPGRNTDQHKLFCLHFADLLKSSSGVQPALPLPSLSEVRAAAHAQPKVSKRPPLIPEFEYTQRIRCAAAPPLNDKNQLKIAWQGVPAKARLLRSFVCKGGDPASQQQSEVRELIFGVFREPVKFVYQAIALQHPFDSARAIPDRILRVLFATLTRGPLVVMKDRLRTLQTWTSWAKELESAEIALHASLHPSVQKVLKGKRLLLLNRIAESLEWPDRNLHRDLCKGFDLSGVLEPTGVFEPDHKPPCASIEQFWDAADVLKGQLWDRVKSQRPQDYDEAVSEITNGETDAPGGKGWLEGPFSWSELESRFNGQWMPCRRFAVWQGKWRAIDDLSESGLNSTFGCHEKIPLRALDEIIWICTRIMQAAAARGEVTFTLSSGQVLRGKLHSFWHDREKIRPVSTTFDLKSAYKQFPLSPSEQCKAVIIVKHPGQSEPVGYVCRTLPFGARGSVLHFNRVSTLLQRILHEVNVLTSLYYDDYPVVTPAFLSANTASIFGSVMRLLGFKIADDKDKPFSSQSETLGVVVDTSDDELRCVRVSNKKSRSDGIATAIDEVMTKGSASPKELPSLFGRLQFAEAQILGRMGRLALHDLRELERSSAAQVPLKAKHLEALQLLKDRVTSQLPRSVSASRAESPIVIFTDGCFEPEADLPAGVGGVMFMHGERDALKVRAFGSVVPSFLLDTWHAQGKRHLIGQVEMFAVLLARACWAPYINGSRVIYFVDHSGVLSACISGCSREETWRKLLCAFEKADAVPALQWFSRVPSHSNISDGPSRGRWSELLQLFPECCIDDPTCPLTGLPLKRFTS